MSDVPSPNGGNGSGRDHAGRFSPGNAGGPGNPFARRVAALRSALLNAVTVDDLRAIVESLVKQARAGDIAAAREILTRVIGKPTDSVDPDRIELEGMQLESDLSIASICRSIGPC